MNGNKPNDPYKFVPIVAHNGYQINDSFLIVQNLQKVIYGRPFTPEESAFDDMLTYQLHPSIMTTFMANDDDMKKFLWKANECPLKCAWYVTCHLGSVRKDGIAKIVKGNKIDAPGGDVDLYMGKVVERLQ